MPFINKQGKINFDLELAPSITKAASKQTYYTIRFLTDRDRMADAYRAYAYFRWVDDVIDAEIPLGQESNADEERIAFVQRQKSLLESCYLGKVPNELCLEEWLLVDLVHHDTENDSGLQMYLRNLMDVMIFDAQRRGRLIPEAELCEYSHRLAKAVTEALFYFIGHDDPAPGHDGRYMAVTAAHIAHMLRDTYADVQAGYFNIPCEVLKLNQITPRDMASNAYRAWVQSRVQLARSHFKSGKEYFRQAENRRCSMAGFAYIARFEWLLDTIEREGYLLRPQYNERRSFGTGLRMSLDTLSSLIGRRSVNVPTQTVPVRKHY
jgi:phytoene/squalene synthetase